MRYLITFLIAAFWAGGVVGQVPQPAIGWLKTIGGNSGDDVLPQIGITKDGGFIVALASTSRSGMVADTFCADGNERSIFIKYDSLGNHVDWFKCFPVNLDTGWLYMIQLNDSVYFKVATATHWSKWLIQKTTLSGHVFWQKTYGATSAQMLRSALLTKDGGLLLAGESASNDGDVGFHYGALYFSDDFWLLKLDSNGNKQWSKVYGGTEDDNMSAVFEAPNGGYYLAGGTESNDFDCTGNHGDFDSYLARIDDTGALLWHRCFGGTDGDAANGACPDGKGGVLLASLTFSTDGDVTGRLSGGMTVWVIDVDSTGAIVWSNCYGGGGYEYPNTMCRAADGSLWVAGRCKWPGPQLDTSYGGEDAFFMHISSNGHHLSTKVVGGSDLDDGTMLFPLKNNRIVAGGYFSSQDGLCSNWPYYGQGDAFLLIFNPWTTDVDDLNRSKTANIYPNPATDYVNITLSNGQPSDITITDAIGKVVFTGRIEGTLKIATAEWATGVYTIGITSKAGAREYRQLMKV